MTTPRKPSQSTSHAHLTPPHTTLMHKTTHPCGCGRTHPPPPPQFQTSPNPKNDTAFCPLQPYHHRHDPRLPDTAVSQPFTVTSLAAAASSWLRSRRIRCLFLLLCSPLLLVLLFAALPFFCAAELWLHSRRKILRDDGGDRLRRCEEGCCGDDEEAEEKGLLHRYLEDQLLLVRSMYDCGDDEEQEEDSGRVEDVAEILSKIPLLR